jgi:hypothetical protein
MTREVTKVMGVAMALLVLSACGGDPRDRDRAVPTSESAPAPTPKSSDPSLARKSSQGRESPPKPRGDTTETPHAKTYAAPPSEREKPRTIQIVITPLRTKFGIPYGAEAREGNSGTLLAKAEQVAMKEQILEVDEVQYSPSGAVIYRGKLFFDAGGELIRQERIEGNPRWRIFTSWNLQRPY